MTADRGIGDDRLELCPRLDGRPGNGERRLPLVGRDRRPDLLDARPREGVGLHYGRGGHPDGGGVLYGEQVSFSVHQSADDGAGHIPVRPACSPPRAHRRRWRGQCWRG